MKRLLLAAIGAMAATTPAWAQSSAATGTGVGVAGSTSTSQAISGKAAWGSRRSPATAACPTNRRSRRPERLCAGPVRGGARNVPRLGFRRRRVRLDRISFGTTIPDPACAARLDARTLWSMGLKKAAVARLALTATSTARCRTFATVSAARAGRSSAAAGRDPHRAGGGCR